MIKGIHHVSLTCTSEMQYQKTIEFYQTIIGMNILRQWPNGIMLQSENDIIEIFLKPEEKDLEQGAIRHFAFLTDNTDACIEKVREAGYTITVEPKDACIPPDYNIRVAFCIGPVGEEIEFFQER